MIDTTAASDVDLQVIDGIDFAGGKVNMTDAAILEHMRYSLRLGFTQARPEPYKSDRIILVGGGPSLDETKDELVELYFAGAKVFTLNGAYHWCLERNIRPSAQIVVDARDCNARFLQPAVPQCRYLVASQCHPSTWDAVNDGREHVFIWHAATGEGPHADLLNAFYFGHWHGIPGGTTVAMRALALLRTMGYVRFDLFGVDSCWSGQKHHAFAQAQNDGDQRLPFDAWPSGHPERRRRFMVSPAHLKQLEDFLQLIRIAGDQFLMNIHGDGLLAFAIREAAEIELAPAKE